MIIELLDDEMLINIFLVDFRYSAEGRTMVTRLENDIFDIMVEPSDWRYSAAIVGLSRYFEDRDKMEDEDYEVDEDVHLKFLQ